MHGCFSADNRAGEERGFSRQRLRSPADLPGARRGGIHPEAAHPIARTTPISAPHFNLRIMKRLYTFRRFSPHSFLSRVSALLLVIGIATGASERSSNKAMLPLLTTAKQILDLSPEDAERGYPVQVVGVVTYYYPWSNTLIVQDREVGILVDPSQTHV